MNKKWRTKTRTVKGAKLETPIPTPVLQQTVHGLGSCGTFAWRDRLTQEGVIAVRGYQVLLDDAELETRWRSLATDDNALDGRTVEVKINLNK